MQDKSVSSKLMKKLRNKNSNESKKKISESDSDSSEYEESDEEEEDQKMDSKHWKRFLYKLFPSKHMRKQIDDEVEESNEEIQESPIRKSKRLEKKKPKKEKKNDEEEDEDEEELEDQTDNIVLSIDPKKLRGYRGDEEEDSEYDSEYSDEEYSDEDYSEEESEEETESDEDSEEETESDEEDVKNKKKNKEEEYTKEDIDSTKKLLDGLRKQLEENPNNVTKDLIKASEKKLKEIEKVHKKKEMKVKKKNSEKFRELTSSKKQMNDYAFLKDMAINEQKNILTEIEQINKIISVDKPYRITLLESSIPVEFKASAMKKINMLKYMEPGGGEFYKIKNWIDTFMKIPFGQYKSLPVSRDDGVEKCHGFMENAKNILDDAVYGLNDAKMQIMQFLGQLITNPTSLGTAIAIKGPMGTGKTTLVKEGISKILGRDFAFLALGGATDSSFLEGHSYTYEGSTWGKIVDILMKSKCMNPVIYFDELDKISDTPKGEEITGILTHLTDTSQNTEFHDKYFSEINLDLSKCLFIFSYNDESKVNPILRDRMYKIQTKGYDQKQKKIICDKHILPRIRDEVKFNNEDIIFEDDVISYIIERYTNKEDGLRNLKRCMEIIHTKLNLYRLMKPDTNLFEGEMSLKVEFPFTVTRSIVDKLIKSDRNDNPSLSMLYL